MHFSKALGFPFRGPNAWVNIGCALLCFLIPIVGPIVLMGYIIRVELVLLENIDADAPRFDFGKFSQYLSRGVQTFLAALVRMFICIPLLLILIAAFAVPGILLLVNEHTAAGVACLVAAGLVEVGGIVLINPLIAPLAFKVGMEDRFSAAFEFRFALDYFRRVGLLAIGMHLLIMLMMLPFAIFFCIPIVSILVVYSVSAVLMFVNAHLQIQLYLEYLQRGGVAINIKPELPEAGFPVLPPNPNPPPIAR